MGGEIISESGGGIIPLQGGAIIPKLGGRLPPESASLAKSAVACEFRGNPARDSDLMSATVPI